MVGNSLWVILPFFKTSDDQFIPVWDERVKYVKDDHPIFDVEDINGDYFFEGNEVKLVEQYFNINTKQHFSGEVINVYPEQKEFKNGDKIVYETKYNHMKISTIDKVVWREYDSSIMKGSDVLKYYEGYDGFTNENIIPDNLYEMRYWNAEWQLADGEIKRHYSIKFIQE